MSEAPANDTAARSRHWPSRGAIIALVIVSLAAAVVWYANGAQARVMASGRRFLDANTAALEQDPRFEVLGIGVSTMEAIHVEARVASKVDFHALRRYFAERKPPLLVFYQVYSSGDPGEMWTGYDEAHGVPKW